MQEALVTAQFIDFPSKIKNNDRDFSKCFYDG